MFVAEGAGYVPVTQLRSRVPAHFGRPQQPQQQQASSPSNTNVALSEDASEWSQNWDRGYNHYHHNYSRVQREYYLCDNHGMNSGMCAMLV